MIELAPSILAADFANLATEVRAALAGGGTVVHVDVMDGHFVPNITLGPPIVKSLRKATDAVLDCHLMIQQPERLQSLESTLHIAAFNQFYDGRDRLELISHADEDRRVITVFQRNPDRLIDECL